MLKKQIKSIEILKSYYPFGLKVLVYELFFTILYGSKFSKEFSGYNGIPTISTPYLFIHIIDKYLKKNNINHVVDIGSGTGKILNFLLDSKKILKNKIWVVNINIDKFNFFTELEFFILSDPFRGKIFFETIEKITKFSKINKQDVYIAYINGYYTKKLKENKNLIIDFQLLNKKESKPKGITIYKIVR